jgi:hypothetical protein
VAATKQEEAQARLAKLQRRLDEEVVPRIVHDIEGIIGKASKKEAVATDESVLVTLDWDPRPLGPEEILGVSYNFKTSWFEMWRIDPEGNQFPVDWERPVYTQLWKDGPQVVFGVKQVADIKKACQSLAK